MAIRVQRRTNVSKQATLLDGFDFSPLRWRVCGCDLNRFVHEGMNHISNLKVHLKTCSGNVNINVKIKRSRNVKNVYTTFAQRKQNFYTTFPQRILKVAERLIKTFRNQKNIAKKSS